MPKLSSKKLEGYISPAEAKLIEAGQGLPLADKTLETLCLKRVGSVVINSLIRNISADSPLATPPYIVIDSAPHPYSADPSELIEIIPGHLPTIKVNNLWRLDVRVGIPLNPDDIDANQLNPDTAKNGIQNPDGIMFAGITWLPTEAAIEELGESDFVEPDQAAYDELKFTRVGSDFEWETRNPDIPTSSQLEFMLFVGKAAGIELPY